MTTYLNAFPIQPVWQELGRLVEAELKTTLNLKSVMLGSFASQQSPSGGLSTLINGIWIFPTPMVENVGDEIPRVFLQKYSFRIVYLRRMGLGENPEQKTLEEGVLIANMLTSKYTIPDITNMPSNAQILWMTVKNIETEPQEDNLVSSIAADIRAIALNVEVNVRVRAR